MPRSTRWRSLVPGLLALAALVAATVATLMYARIGQLHGDTVRYYVAFPGARNVMGGTEVWINGVKVGRVQNVRFAPVTTDTASRVVVELEVLKQYRDQIRESSVARLRTGARLMGPTVVYVSAGTPDSPPVPEGGRIRGASGGDIQAVTASFGDVARELPEIMANVKVLSASLSSTRGTIGALTSTDAPKRIDALIDNTTRLTDRALSDTGTIGLLVNRGRLIARARAATASADSLRTFLASDRSSFGRFRRDSTLLRAVADVRDELAITQRLLSTPRGTLGRFAQDSIIAVQMAEVSKQMDELFADIKKRPFRYIAF